MTQPPSPPPKFSAKASAGPPSDAPAVPPPPPTPALGSWYVTDGTLVTGPVPEVVLLRQVIDGTLGPAALVCRVGDTSWHRVDRIPFLYEAGVRAEQQRRPRAPNLPVPGLAALVLPTWARVTGVAAGAAMAAQAALSLAEMAHRPQSMPEPVVGVLSMVVGVLGISMVSASGRGLAVSASRAMTGALGSAVLATVLFSSLPRVFLKALAFPMVAVALAAAVAGTASASAIAGHVAETRAAAHRYAAAMFPTPQRNGILRDIVVALVLMPIAWAVMYAVLVATGP